MDTEETIRLLDVSEGLGFTDDASRLLHHFRLAGRNATINLRLAKSLQVYDHEATAAVGWSSHHLVDVCRPVKARVVEALGFLQHARKLHRRDCCAPAVERGRLRLAKFIPLPHFVDSIAKVITEAVDIAWCYYFMRDPITDKRTTT